MSFAVIVVLVTVGLVFWGCAPPEPTGTGGPSGTQVAGPPPTPEQAAPEKEPVETPQTEAAEPSEQPPAKEAEPAAAAAELDLAPPVSTYAPAENLVAQVEQYLEDLQEAVQSEEEYNDSVDKIAKQANTLILIALALGLHDTDNPYQAAAPALLKAAQQLARTDDYASAKEAVAALRAAAASSDGDSSQLQWEKLASLPEIMKAVPLINTRIKRYLRSESRLKKASDDVAGYAAVLAVIAQGSLASSDETEKPNEVEQWQAFCVEMRDLAGGVNKAVRKFSEEGTPEAFEAAKAAMQALNQNCEACHEVFHPDEATATDEQ